jgi:hypothetical protein
MTASADPVTVEAGFPRIVIALVEPAGGALEAELDEARHPKALRFSTQEREGGDGMDLGRP